MSYVPGTYRYCRVGHDERQMELCPNGIITIGAGGAERRWELRSINYQSILSIYGAYGEICRLMLDSDGCWRGHWLQFERMLVELVPQQLQPMDFFNAPTIVSAESLPQSFDSSQVVNRTSTNGGRRSTPFSIALVSGYSSNWRETGQLTMPVQRDYASRHGYELHVFEDEAFHHDRPASWSKLKFLEQLIDRYDWLWWLDADALVTNPAVILDQFLCSGNAQMIIGQDWNGINAGSFFLRRGDWAHAFLHDAWEQTDLIHHDWWEQAAITRLMDRPVYRDQIDIQPHWRFNGYVDGPTRRWRPGDFVLHFAGVPDRERRIQEFLADQTVSPHPVGENEPISCDLRGLLSVCHEFGENSGWWGMTLPVIYGLAVGCRAKSMLEIGVHKGASTRALLLAAGTNDGFLISIDLEDCSKVVPAELKPRWVFRHGDSRSVMPILTGPFDFALIDGEHTREAVEFELHYLKNLISPGGIILLDDCWATWQGVLDAFLAFQSARPFEKTLVPYGQPQSLGGP